MIILGTNSIKDTGYNVANSARFGVNTYMHKAFSSDNEKDTWTFSLWVKRGNSGSTQRMMTHNGATSGKFFYLRWESNEQLHFHIGMSDGNFAGFDTTQVFRDHSAWSHIVCAVDTTQGTEANRVKIYVNGSQVTAFGTANYPAQNTTASIGRTDTPMVVGALYGSGYGITSGSPQEFYDGYLAEVCFIDDAQLAADQFGEFDSDSGIWKPKDVSGLTFGTDGFYLDFEDSGNLGNDANGGTDLTEVNLAATDQSTDTCTNNFATMNPLDNYYAAHPFSEGNLNVTTSTSTTTFSTSTFGLSKGKWYFEAKLEVIMGEEGIGVSPLVSTATDDYPGKATDSVSYKGNNGDIRKSNSNSSYGDSYAANDIIGVLLNLDDNEIKFSKNGTVQNSGTAVALTAAASTPNGVYFPMVGDGSSDSAGRWSLNFGSPSYSESGGETDGNGYGNFAHSVPSGHFSINSKNLAEYG